MATANSIRRIRDEDIHVSPEARPGWVAGSDRLPRVGEDVFCTAGAGVVQALLGRTGDGTRILEIRLEDPAAKPFFASAANVLVAPE